ncbi:hypothetical protein LJR225_001556 [Phenylobacterium sp. LjRoot225]|uniref:hypothetical protein n=1 Tax=Phenylobacterium sp. LjRoot225 TaxID=3342285 RepID=UPI003ECEF714
MTAADPLRPRALSRGSRRARHDTFVLMAFFVAEFAIVALLQKFALPAGALSISILIPLLYVGLGVAMVTSTLGVSLIRVLTFGLLLLVALTSQLLVGRPFSAPSFLMLIVLYFPMIFIWKMSIGDYRRVIEAFQNVMVIGAVMVFVQLGWEFAFGLGTTLSIEPLAPRQLLLPGYIYEAPFQYGAAFVRPNGFFFLEPSFVSMFLAAALILELTEFSRPLRIGLYGGALIACLGATGVVMVAVAAPWILRRMKPKMLMIVLVLAASALIAALAFGGAELAASRLAELSRPGTSASERIVAPLRQLNQLSMDPERLVTGSGAGNMSAFQASSWPIVKLLDEYGALTTLAYLLLFIAAIWRAPSTALAVGLFVVINFTGGYLLNPVPIFMVVLLLSMPRVAAKAPPRARPATSRARAQEAEAAVSA